MELLFTPFIIAAILIVVFLIIAWGTWLTYKIVWLVREHKELDRLTKDAQSKEERHEVIIRDRADPVTRAFDAVRNKIPPPPEMTRPPNRPMDENYKPNWRKLPKPEAPKPRPMLDL